MAGFPDILNHFRHNGVFGIGETPYFRAQRHGDKCSRHINVSKQIALLEKHQTGIRVENSLLGSDLDLKCLQRLSADDTSRQVLFYLVLVQPIPT